MATDLEKIPDFNYSVDMTRAAITDFSVVD